MTPSACRSLPAKIAVGGSGSASSSRPCASPPPGWKSPNRISVGIDRQAGGVHGRAVAVDAGERAHHVFGAGDGRDPAVAELDQVARGHQAARPVGRADRRHIGRGIARRVDDHERDAAGAELLAVPRRDVGEDQDHADRAATQHAVDPLGGRGVPVAAHGQHDRQAGGVCDVLDALDDLHRPARLEFVEDQLDELGALRRVAAGVAVAGEMLLEAGAGGGRDIGPTVQNLRHRRQ